MFVQRMRDLQPANECKCRNILTIVGEFGQLALKVANVRFEVVTLPHPDSKKMMVVPLTLQEKYVLGEEHFGYLLEVSKRMWKQEVEPI